MHRVHRCPAVSGPGGRGQNVRMRARVNGKLITDPTPLLSPPIFTFFAFTITLSHCLRASQRCYISLAILTHSLVLIMAQTADSPRGSADLRHPVPDLQSLQGAYVSNIERLEERAERMSSHGSDIGEEIRKLQLEQKLSDSRKSSMRSGHVDESKFIPGTRSRNASTSSFTNSIVDVNGAARWGGYSPAGFVASPVGSPQSPQSHRQRASSRASRLGQVIHTENDADGQGGREHVLGRSVSQRSAASAHSRRAPSNHSTTSFSRTYDQIAQEIQENFNIQDNNYDNPHDYPDRPATAASTDTYLQARTLFTDFDGVHCEAVIEEEGHTPRSSSSQARQSAMMHPPPTDGMVYYPAPVPKTLNLPKRLSQLPAANVQARRRTQLLEAMTTENRKSAPWLGDDGFGHSAKDNRKSMDPRKSRQSLAGLPPQLRASAFFDQAVPLQEIEVKGESAEDTLEQILDASARAPVTAFTDHPIVGHVGSEVYGKEKNDKNRKSTATLMNDHSDDKKRRSSLNLLNAHRNSSGDPLNKLKKRNSSADLNRLIVRESTSRMSLSGEFEGEIKDTPRDQEGGDATPTAKPVDGEPESIGDRGEDEVDDQEEEEEPPAPQYFGPPTTLLAELQMRKMQQKSRNRTAATAFPDGMHSTLLELDAVAEIERKKRKAARVPLAWEAPEDRPGEDDDSDEDVPLGVLFPGRDGLANKAATKQVSDWDRPLGLIAQRELEENEPLSRRRNRLLGNNPNKPRTISPLKRGSQLDLPIPTLTPPQPEDEEEEGETLAQRIRRLKNREALDSTVADARKSTVSAEFASELLSQLGTPADEDKPKVEPAPEDPEEETLGQRRARLQAEAAARGDDAIRPKLKTSLSLADILSAHPVESNSNLARGMSDEKFVAALPQGSLLHANEIKQERHKQNRISSFGALDKPLLDVGQKSPEQTSPGTGGLLEKNDMAKSRLKADMLNQSRRISSYGSLDRPLVGNLGNEATEQPIAAKIEAFKGPKLGATPMATPSPSMMFMPQMAGAIYPGMPMAAAPQNPYFPATNMPMGMGMGMGYPAGNMMPQQMMGMGMGMNMNMGMGMPMGMGMGLTSPSMPNLRTYPPPGMGAMSAQMQMGMGMQQQMDPQMDPRQRDMIDRWRNQVMH